MPARYPTLLDFANTLDPDGRVGAVAEILNTTNEIMADWTFQEGNLITGHSFMIRTGLPSVTWRKFYGGVLPDKATQERVNVSTAMLEAYNEVDKKMADLNGNSAAFRLNQARAQLEAMSQALATALFYGDSTVNPEQIDGLALHFNSLTAANEDNIIRGGGSGSDNASIWLIGWDPGKVYGVFPKGSKAGITADDKGQVTLEAAPDGSGGRMEAYRMHFGVDVGLCIEDWRNVVRIANIDRSLLTADISSGADLPNLMSDAVERLNMKTPNTAFYMDRSLRQIWRKQMAHKLKTSSLEEKDVGGVMSPDFEGVPIRRCDALRVDEATVS